MGVTHAMQLPQPIDQSHQQPNLTHVVNDALMQPSAYVPQLIQELQHHQILADSQNNNMYNVRFIADSSNKQIEHDSQTILLTLRCQ